MQQKKARSFSAGTDAYSRSKAAAPRRRGARHGGNTHRHLSPCARFNRSCFLTRPKAGYWPPIDPWPSSHIQPPPVETPCDIRLGSVTKRMCPWRPCKAYTLSYQATEHQSKNCSCSGQRSRPILCRIKSWLQQQQFLGFSAVQQRPC